MSIQSMEQQAKQLFFEAIDVQDGPRRQQFLEEACDGNADLLAQVLELLRCDGVDTGDKVNHALGNLRGAHGNFDVTFVESDGQIPQVIGPYKLLEPIGDGGMGMVYMASQEAPIRRLVAIKIIKPGMDSAQVVARFEAERQALALMNHPNIAKVLDAGQTEAGLPYFVMELVKGKPINQFVITQNLSLKQRLLLLIQICDAVQHAHQKGIIHRDLKPSNVLVELHDVTPVPKVIDFGIAKAIGQRLTEKTLFTGFFQLIGTPLYMSPEQAQLSSLDIDTRSDVYSLGVLLYELVTGTTPFDGETLKQVGFDEMRRIIREDEPPKPSDRISTLKAEALTTISDGRATSPKEASRLLRGELDWIVMKAIDKDRSRRYGSPAELATDLQRYLNQEPVLAGPPSTSYRLKKLCQRQRAAVSVAGVLIATLLAAAGFSARQATIATQAAKQSEQDAAVAKAVNEFVTQDLLAQADPSEKPDADIMLRTAVDRAAASVGDRFRDRPAVEVALRETIGDTYKGLGRYEEAEEQFRKSLFLRDSKAIGDLSDLLETKAKLAACLTKQARLKEAYGLYQEVRDKRIGLFGKDTAETIKAENFVYYTLAQLGEYEEAELKLRELYERSKLKLGEENEITIGVLTNLGYPLSALHKFDERRDIAQRLYDLNTQVHGPGHPDTLNALKNLAMSKLSDKPADAVELYQAGLEQCVARFGEDHPESLGMRVGLANAYDAHGNKQLAETHYRKALTALREPSRPFDYNTAMCLNNLANIVNTKDVQEAKGLYAEAASGLAETYGRDHPQTQLALSNVANCARELGKYEEAEQIEITALAILRSKFGVEHSLTLSIQQNLVETLHKAGRSAEALQLVEDSLKSARRAKATASIFNGLNLKAAIEVTLGEAEKA